MSRAGVNTARIIKVQLNDVTAAPGVAGVAGPIGPQGPQGIQGIQGPQGETGIGGGVGSRNVDGGTANSVYLPSQIINGGAAA